MIRMVGMVRFAVSLVLPAREGRANEHHEQEAKDESGFHNLGCLDLHFYSATFPLPKGNGDRTESIARVFRSPVCTVLKADGRSQASKQTAPPRAEQHKRDAADNQEPEVSEVFPDCVVEFALLARRPRQAQRVPATVAVRHTRSLLVWPGEGGFHTERPLRF
jgi:hypothetical protein